VAVDVTVLAAFEVAVGHAAARECTVVSACGNASGRAAARYIAIIAAARIAMVGIVAGDVTASQGTFNIAVDGTVALAYSIAAVTGPIVVVAGDAEREGQAK
jgi:hypothetical protein